MYNLLLGWAVVLLFPVRMPEDKPDPAQRLWRELLDKYS